MYFGACIQLSHGMIGAFAPLRSVPKNRGVFNAAGAGVGVQGTGCKLCSAESI